MPGQGINTPPTLQASSNQLRHTGQSRSRPCPECHCSVQRAHFTCKMGKGLKNNDLRKHSTMTRGLNLHPRFKGHLCKFKSASEPIGLIGILWMMSLLVVYSVTRHRKCRTG
eukprot:3309768-Amphidinium_carterae.2